MARALAFVLLVGCGGSQRAASSAPDCATVADHLVVLAEHDNLASAGADGPALQAELHGRCREEAWSSERRRCLVDAQDQDATLGCPVE